MTQPDDELVRNLLQTIEDETLVQLMRVYKRWVLTWIVALFLASCSAGALIVSVRWWFVPPLVAFAILAEIAYKRGQAMGDRVALILDPKGGHEL